MSSSSSPSSWWELEKGKMASTPKVGPDLSHLTSQDFKNVYEPAEDTYLFVDALRAQLTFLDNLNPSACLELGPGSGTLITHLAMLLGGRRQYFALDINMDACLVTARTATQNNVDVNCICSDMFTTLRTGFKFDLILFNPPYVPTEEDELGRRDIVASWAGGEDGRVVIDRFLDLVPERLNPGGVLYLLLIEENRPKEVMGILKERGFDFDGIVLKKRAANEMQYIFKFLRQR